MNFLVIAQDLRVSGTSEGVVSRSFLAKLRMAYPSMKQFFIPNYFPCVLHLYQSINELLLS